MTSQRPYKNGKGKSDNEISRNEENGDENPHSKCDETRSLSSHPVPQDLVVRGSKNPTTIKVQHRSKRYRAAYLLWVGVTLAGFTAAGSVVGIKLYQEQTKLSALQRPITTVKCDVVIAGGSTSALAAALASASEGAKTCLIERTDWVGGQLTASGVPAIDWAWHEIIDAKTKKVEVDVESIARDRRNITPNLYQIASSVKNPGNCWVSRNCFEPKNLLAAQLKPQLENVKDNLTVFYDTVLTGVETKDDKIIGITTIHRIKQPTRGGFLGEVSRWLETVGLKEPTLPYYRLPSKDIPDWYSVKDSSYYQKSFIKFDTSNSVVIEGTEWGEVLALSGASYRQGVELNESTTESNDRCGQAIVFGFVEELHGKATSESVSIPSAADSSQKSYALKGKDTDSNDKRWNEVWSYRRLRSSSNKVEAQAGDLTLQNWNPGNDYNGGYLFKSKAETEKEVHSESWAGGVDYSVMAAAEKHAYGFHTFVKHTAPLDLRDRITLNTTVLGTHHGLSKEPYIRDSRRVISKDNFQVTVGDITGPGVTGTKFYDRVAIGAYDVDIHGISTCTYPSQVKRYEVLPFYIPFRAMTSETYSNLISIGKTMSQTFVVNGATRVHPVEWASGTAGGVIAAEMARKEMTSEEALEDISTLQEKVKRRTPIDWTTNPAYVAAGQRKAKNEDKHKEPKLSIRKPLLSPEVSEVGRE